MSAVSFLEDFGVDVVGLGAILVARGRRQVRNSNSRAQVDPPSRTNVIAKKKGRRRGQVRMSFKAWSYTSPPFPSTLTQVQVSPPDPDQLQPTQLIVQVVAAALNPVDVQLANFSPFKLPQLAFPKGLGSDFSGTVISKGSEVDFEIGDEVLGLAFVALGKPIERSLSQIILLDMKTAVVVRKPMSISWHEAAAIPLAFLTAITTLSPPFTLIPSHFKNTSSTTPPQKPTIVVLGGSSAVGIFAIQYATIALNAKVIATCSSAKEIFVKSLGAETTIDYMDKETSIRDKLLSCRPPEGYLSIIDCVGGKDLISDSSVFKALVTPRSQDFKQGGAYLTIVGDKTERTVMGGALLYWWYWGMFLRWFLGWLGFLPRYNAVDLDQKAELLQRAIYLKEKGMQVPIDSVWKFEEVPQAFGKLNEGKTKGKVVIQVSGQ
ncbi:GroES-like protein [Meredithblackwellia eburnea MCA 4105]